MTAPRLQCGTATIRSVALPLVALTAQDAHDSKLSREDFIAMSFADRDRWLAAQAAIREARERKLGESARRTAIYDAATRHNRAAYEILMGREDVDRVRIAQSRLAELGRAC